MDLIYLGGSSIIRIKCQLQETGFWYSFQVIKHIKLKINTYCNHVPSSIIVNAEYVYFRRHFKWEPRTFRVDQVEEGKWDEPEGKQEAVLPPREGPGSAPSRCSIWSQGYCSQLSQCLNSITSFLVSVSRFVNLGIDVYSTRLGNIYPHFPEISIEFYFPIQAKSNFFMGKGKQNRNKV